LAVAQTENYTWLLTLDQDTTLPSDYLSRLSKVALEIESDNRVAAIVPRVSDAGRPLSPVFPTFWGVSYLRHGFEGIARRDTYAINSASLFRISALKQIGGFNPYFWLDFLDAYVYRQLHQHGWNVYIAGDIQLEHRLSLLHKEDLRPDRFQNILQAESVFCDLYGGHIRGLALTGRLLCRIRRQQKRKDNPAIRELTWNELKRRVLQSKRRRINDWRREMEQRMLCSSGAEKGRELSGKRPAISVCMAAYNGEQYITAQLQSILVQLSNNDEVVVVDDGSTDGTRDRVRSLRDDRIRLIEHEHNQGMSHAFEDAIRGASNSILFLSDQDDLWVPDKISTIRQAFIDNPRVTLIVTDSSLIHADGSLLLESYLGRYGPFRPGFWANLVRNRYGSHNLAFQTSILSEILPLPHKHAVRHDHWIGLRHSLAHGDALYIDRPFTLSRRHGTTSTGRKRSSTLDKIGNRVHLLLALAEFSILKVFGLNARGMPPPENDSRNNAY
jgi:GT2 family glycosyltransferase